MLLKLYYDPSTSISDRAVNEGFEEALRELRNIESEEIDVEFINTNGMSREELWQAYSDACSPSVVKHIGVRRVFGTKRRSGVFFSKQVPALLVYKEGAYPSDVYPHQKPGRGPVITIRDFLEGLKEE